MLKRSWDVVRYLFLNRVDTLLGLLAAALAVEATRHTWVTYFAGALLLVLLVRVIFEVYRTVEKFRTKHLPLLIIAGRDDDEVRAMWNDVKERMKSYQFDPSFYEKQFEISNEEWFVHHEADLGKAPREWINFVHRAEQRVIKLSAKLQGRKVFHLFLNGPAALFVGVGAALGTKYEVVIHHNELGTDGLPYFPIIGFNAETSPLTEGKHAAKTRVEPPFQFLDVRFPASYSPTVLVSLALAAHPPTAWVEKASNAKNISAVFINNTYHNTLPLGADWKRAAQEVASSLLRLTETKEVELIDVYLSMPVPLAFATGMALGLQSNFRIFNWFSKDTDYFPVLTLNELRRPR